MMMINAVTVRNQTGGSTAPFACSPSVSSWVAPSAIAPSSCSSVVIPSPAAAGVDFDSADTSNGGGLRASSLVRMWREVESEASNKPQDSGGQSPSRRSFSSSHSGSPKETCKEQSPDVPGVGGRVADIVRKLTTMGTNNHTEADPNITSDPVVACPISTSNIGEKNEVKSPDAAAAANGSSVGEDGSNIEEPSSRQTAVTNCRPDHEQAHGIETMEWLACNKNIPRVRGRLATIDLLSRMKDEREREIGMLKGRHTVSEFSHGSRLRALLRFKILHKGDATKYQRPDHASIPPRANSSRLGVATNPPVKEKLPSASETTGKRAGAQQETSIPSSCSSHQTVDARGETVAPSVKIQLEEFIGKDDKKEGTLVSKDSSLFDEIAVTADITNDIRFQPEGAVNGVESCCSNENGGTVEGQEEEEEAIFSGYPQPSWESCRSANTRYFWMDSNTSDNSELQLLVQRKCVSTSLASKFREKMEQLIMSRLERQEQQSGLEDDEGIEGWYHYLQQKQRCCVTGDKVLDHSLSSCSHTSHLTEATTEHDDRKSESRHSESLELEVMHSLKTEVSELRSWISSLQKSVDNFMDLQLELNQSIKQVLSAVSHNRDV